MTSCKDCNACGFLCDLKFYRRFGCYLCSECADKRLNSNKKSKFRFFLISVVVLFMFAVLFLLLNANSVVAFLNVPINISHSQDSYYFDSSSNEYKCVYANLCYEERTTNCSSVKMGCLSCCVKKY